MVSTLQLLAQYSVLVMSYLGLALGYLLELRMNRITIALVGSALLIGLGLVNVEQGLVGDRFYAAGVEFDTSTKAKSDSLFVGSGRSNECGFGGDN